MKKALTFVGWSLLVAIPVHLAVVWAAPSLIMKVVLHKAGQRAPQGQAYHSPPITPKARQVVMPSPDLLYTLCVFDVSQRPLKIRATVPTSYWSMAMYDDATNHFYVANDKQAGPGKHTWLLTSGTNTAPPTSAKGATVVKAPTSRGLILFRLLIDDKSKLTQLQAIQRQASCQPM